MPGGSRDAPRSAEYKHREAAWNEHHQRSQAELKQRFFGAPVVDLDVYGNPDGSNFIASRDVTGEDVALGLERALEATGDPIFADALTCLKAYGLAEEAQNAPIKKQKMQSLELTSTLFRNIRSLIENWPKKYLSVRSAAEEVASSYFYKASNFETAVETLRKAYSAWQQNNFPPRQLSMLIWRTPGIVCSQNQLAILRCPLEERSAHVPSSGRS